MIEIVPYRAEWPAEFARVGAAVRQALGERALRIDHIGSTAVPGLPAKDLIDVQVTVGALAPLAPLRSALAGLGFTMFEGITHDHVPPAADASPAEWEKRFFKATTGRPVNLHVRVAGRANQRYPLLFREYLRASAAAGYAAVKQALAQYHPANMDAYYDIKDPVCDVIMAAAEPWADATGWQPGPSDA